MYLVVTDDQYELPLAVGDTLKEIAGMCKGKVSTVSRAISKNSRTMIFGTPAKIYRVEDDE